MEPHDHRRGRLSWAQWLPYMVTGLVLVVLIATVSYTRQQLRQKIRQQISGRDGDILAVMALTEQRGDEWVGSLEDPANQFALLLQIAQVRGVIAARLFDVQGEFVNASPADVKEATLAADELAQLRQLKPQSHFLAAAHISDYFYQSDTASDHAAPALPLLVVNVPLHRKDQGQMLGVAQFIIDGASIAREYAALDQHLLRQTAVVSLVGALVVAVILVWAFQRLQRVNRLLSERTNSLLHANQELSLAAKTSAVGAVTAHLVHGLKNPLSGLHSFVANHLHANGSSQNPDWVAAVATTRRMQQMIDEVVRVVHEDQSTSAYEISLSELVTLIQDKTRNVAQTAGVQFQVQRTAEAVFTNREANLILLILDNLVQNAIQATPRGKTVSLTFTRPAQALVCTVRDEGAGFPEALKESLFAPCRSTKQGGSGIGLAISHQLAQHLGAKLELQHSSPQGCIFVLTLSEARTQDG